MKPVWTAITLVGVALGAATALRYGLVEPADVAQRCDAEPWGSAACAVRTIVVQIFINERLGVAAMVIGCIALAKRLSWVALLAGMLAAAGLVLYGAGWSAPGAVLALLAWVSATWRDVMPLSPRSPR